MKTYSALFAGFDLAGHGLQAAGFEPLDLFEFDPDRPKLSGAIADIGQANTSGRYIRRDVCEVDWMQFERPDLLWASPVCKNASIANSDGEESGVDIATAEATCSSIRVWKPEIVCIENVWGYRNFKAFGLICNALRECGYSFDYWHLNAADYGVPQTRRRLILIAIRQRGLKITRPPVTHHDPRRLNAEQNCLFGPETLPWVGWYEAIEDLILGLPESQFAEWQLKRLPESALRESFLQMTCNTSLENPSGKFPCRSDSPTNTVVATTHALRSRAFLGDDQTSQPGSMASIRDAIEPALTVSTRNRGGTVPRAFVCHDTEMRHTPVRAVGLDRPDRLIGSANGRANGNMPRAFVLDGQNGGREISLRGEREPFLTLTAQNKGAHRAFIVDGKPRTYAGELQITDRDNPVVTITASQTKHPFRAWLEMGRVVKMTPRALARFQSVPDSFQLSGKDSIDCAGIGNGVPCTLAQAVANHAQSFIN